MLTILPEIKLDQGYPIPNKHACADIDSKDTIGWSLACGASTQRINEGHTLSLEISISGNNLTV